jgi:enoyl-CoA hydratase
MEQRQYIVLEREEHIAICRMSNPPRHTMVPPEVAELNRMLNQLEADPEVRVLILTGGSEEFFVRHFDVGVLADSSERQRDGAAAPAALAAGDATARLERSYNGFMRRLERWPGLVIAALNGSAGGGGFELALACDFRLMREGKFTLGLGETGVGIIPGSGGTQRLPRMIGPQRALDFIVHGTHVGPSEALAAGLVHRVFATEHYWDEVMEFARNLARRAPLALRAAKRAIREGIEGSLDEGLRLEGELFRELMQSEDAALALRAAARGQRYTEFKGS